MTQLVQEMDCNVAGICVLFDTTTPSNKLVDKYISLIKYEGIDANDQIMVHPNYEFL
jgi:hypothetical protein